MGRSRLWLLLVIAISPVGCTDRQPIENALPTASGWTLSVAAAPEVVPIEAVWIGLGNPGRKAEIVCVRSVDVIVRGVTGDIATGTSSSPHSDCEGAARSILVKGGENHFFAFDLSNNGILPDNRFRVTVTFSSRGGSTQPPNIGWEGTGAEAQSLMQTMLTGLSSR